MYHTIQFHCDFTADREISPRHHLERLLIRKGDCFRTQLKPYVVETGVGPVEVADLFFEDGTAARQVPFSLFSFRS